MKEANLPTVLFQLQKIATIATNWYGAYLPDVNLRQYHNMSIYNKSVYNVNAQYNIFPQNSAIEKSDCLKL